MIQTQESWPPGVELFGSGKNICCPLKNDQSCLKLLSFLQGELVGTLQLHIAQEIWIFSKQHMFVLSVGWIHKQIDFVPIELPLAMEPLLRIASDRVTHLNCFEDHPFHSKDITCQYFEMTYTTYKVWKSSSRIHVLKFTFT